MLYVVQPHKRHVRMLFPPCVPTDVELGRSAEGFNKIINEKKLCEQLLKVSSGFQSSLRGEIFMSKNRDWHLQESVLEKWETMFILHNKMTELVIFFIRCKEYWYLYSNRLSSSLLIFLTNWAYLPSSLLFHFFHDILFKSSSLIFLIDLPGLLQTTSWSSVCSKRPSNKTHLTQATRCLWPVTHDTCGKRTYYYLITGLKYLFMT